MDNTSKKFFKLGLINVQSLNTGRDELQVTVMKYRPDILAVNETWLRDGQEGSAPAIPGYTFIHRARTVKKKEVV